MCTLGAMVSGKPSLLKRHRSRRISNLIFGPDAGNSGRAVLTASFARDGDLANQITKPFHQQLIARRTPRVFPTSHSARQIAGVDVTQPHLTADFTRTNQLLGRRGFEDGSKGVRGKREK